MAKVILTLEDQKKDKLKAWIRNRSKEEKVTQGRLAQVCLTDQPHFSRKLQNCNFSFVELVKIIHELNGTEEDLKELFI